MESVYTGQIHASHYLLTAAPYNLPAPGYTVPGVLFQQELLYVGIK